MSIKKCTICKGNGEYVSAGYSSTPVATPIKCLPCDGTGYVATDEAPSYETRLHDEYLGQIMQSFCAAFGPFDSPNVAGQLVENAVTVVDAMMQARKQGGE